MLLKKVLMSASAASLAISPVALSAAPVERASQSASETSELGGPGLIIAVIAGIAIIVGIVIAASDDDDEPFSP